MKKFLLFMLTVISICAPAQTDLKQGIKVTYVQTPDFAGHILPMLNEDVFELSQISITPNNVTDNEEWFSKNNLKKDCIVYSFYGYQSDAPVNIAKKRLFPSQIEKHFLIYCEEYATYYIVYYSLAGNYGDISLLSIYDKQINHVATLNFDAFRQSPRVVKGDEDYVIQSVSYARLLGKILYVQHGHSTYSASSYNQNAYISAINILDGSIIWTTEPLTCNSNFVIVDKSIICGYGFTKEPDYLYVVDINSGARRKQYQLPKATEFIVVKDNNVYVRTYNKDCIFKIVNY